jgi:hypothetical protein
MDSNTWYVLFNLKIFGGLLPMFLFLFLPFFCPIFVTGTTSVLEHLSNHKHTQIYDPKKIYKFIFFQTLDVQLVYWEFFSNIGKYFATTCGLAECIFCWFQMQYSVYIKLDAGDWWCYSFQQCFCCLFSLHFYHLQRWQYFDLQV